MPRGVVTEAEYEALKRKSSSAVRFSDSNRSTSSTRFRAGAPRVVRRYARRKRSGGLKNYIPVAVGIGAVVLAGTWLYNRNSQVGGLGTYAGYGAMVGGAIGSIIPVLGTAIGSMIGGVIGGLIGPSAHYTPSGMFYDTAATDLKNNAVELAGLMNELYAKVGNPTRVPVPQWTMTSADDPKTGPYLANLLGDPSFKSATSPDALIALQANGVYDNAIQLQETIISAIETALTSLDDGTSTVSAGTVVPAGSPIAQDANSTVAQAQAGQSATAGTSSSTGFCSAGTSNFLAANGRYILGGLCVLGLILILRKRGS